MSARRSCTGSVEWRMDARTGTCDAGSCLHGPIVAMCPRPEVEARFSQPAAAEGRWVNERCVSGKGSSIVTGRTGIHPGEVDDLPFFLPGASSRFDGATAPPRMMRRKSRNSRCC